MSNTQDKLNTLLNSAERRLAEVNIASLAVAATQDGAVLCEGAIGWADRANHLPATAHTPYSLASISKPVTATALMQLVERGQIDLDAPINTYLGDAKLSGRAFDARDATVRRVLNHTAGLPLHYQFFYADEPRRRPSMDETILRYANLVSMPGERFQYSNLGYGLLDYVIERLSGKCFADYVREHLFNPLGMFRSAVDLPTGLEHECATRYGRDGVAYPFYEFDHPGGSAVFASAHDLARFGAFHCGVMLPDQARVLTDASRIAMQSAEANGYALGWDVDRDFGGLCRVSHSGGMGGVATWLWVFPDERLAVTALTNSSGDGSLTPLGVEIIEDLIAGVIPAFAERLPALRTEHQAPVATQTVPLQDLAGVWEGVTDTYRGERSLRLTFQEDGDVHVEFAGQLITLLNDTVFHDGWLSGRFSGDIHTPDASRRRHLLQLDLRSRDDVLNGALIAISENVREGGAPGDRVGNALAHWTSLRRC